MCVGENCVYQNAAKAWAAKISKTVTGYNNLYCKSVHTIVSYFINFIIFNGYWPDIVLLCPIIHLDNIYVIHYACFYNVCKKKTKK